MPEDFTVSEEFMSSDEITLKVITNNVPRNRVWGYELTQKERKEFDYMPEIELDNADFFRYRGMVFATSEMLLIDRYTCDVMRGTGYDGYTHLTAFSGVLVKYASRSEQVIVARFSC